ncbi:uncharacterized protein BO80DRAFT_450626 [Aspergillus ibericus CBS 121593]|uniref:Uncharacterized protein n=1 Tax=Aspergillus ibericus CBS 121593 TaxID=1448316 RepID=A0A395GLR3_9EURO|nr:hypothetical protein BO80DRAFT_450626 [Aspergillus ibericus CBS 121593]RAK94963.1 hypothetical protein BO80DRAFT_450626 [Aspergillus ibericus CBS 121593]
MVPPYRPFHCWRLYACAVNGIGTDGYTYYVGITNDTRHSADSRHDINHNAAALVLDSNGMFYPAITPESAVIRVLVAGILPYSQGINKGNYELTLSGPGSAASGDRWGRCEFTKLGPCRYVGHTRLQRMMGIECRELTYAECLIAREWLFLDKR